MKNKALKNLIVLGAFVVFVLGARNADAAIGFYSGGSTNNYPTYTTDYNSYYADNYNNQNVNQYDYLQQPYTTYVQAQPKTEVKYVTVQAPTQIKYVQVPGPTQVKYVSAPATTQQVQYVPQQQATTQYVVPANTQGASVVRSNSVAVVNKNTGTTGNTGQYVNYDANGQYMLASAYGAYNGQQATQQVVAYDPNGVTALTVNGSGSFMPSSVFQWFLIVILILAIVIVARMVSKTFSKDNHAAVAH